MATATRELAEETGIADARIESSPTFTESYLYEKKTGERVEKTVTYYLGYVDREDVTIRPGELKDYAWLNAAGTAAKLTYPESRRVLEAVEEYLGGR